MLVTGAGLAAARSLSQAAWELVLRRYVVRAEFDSRDDSYRWLISWLAEHPSQMETKHFSVTTTLRRLGHSQLSSDDDGGLLLIPTGRSVLRYAGRWLLISRERQEERAGTSGKERESLTLQLLGGSREQLVQLVEEARAAYVEREQSRTSVYFVDEYGSWTCVSSMPSRTLISVVLGTPEQAATAQPLSGHHLCHRPATATAQPLLSDLLGHRPVTAQPPPSHRLATSLATAQASPSNRLQPPVFFLSRSHQPRRPPSSLP